MSRTWQSRQKETPLSGNKTYSLSRLQSRTCTTTGLVDLSIYTLLKNALYSKYLTKFNKQFTINFTFIPHISYIITAIIKCKIPKFSISQSATYIYCIHMSSSTGRVLPFAQNNPRLRCQRREMLQVLKSDTLQVLQLATS